MPNPTSTQGALVGMLDYRYPGYSNPHIGNTLDVMLEFFGADVMMGADDREIELSSMYSPTDYSTNYVNGVRIGYVNDGRTILFDLDGDGTFDGAGTTNQNNQVYWFTAQGWQPDTAGTTLTPLF